MAPEVRQLLKAALRLVDAGEAQPATIAKVGEKEFRVIAERHEYHGWIVLLMEEPPRSPCDYTLMTQFDLTDRQVQVARLLADRYSDREIAEELGITLSTASSHTENVMRKLDVSRRKDIAALLRDSCSDN